MKKTVTIYTDGACSGNPGAGGYAGIIKYNEHEKVVVGGDADTTNNRMEMLAVITSLESLTEPCNVELYSDSKYILDALGKGWAKNWQKNNWIKSDKKPALNKDLWERLLNLTEIHELSLHWVKGHNGNHFNERCDKLAVEQSQLYKK